jgi:probable F420-dependent oxidoreductase
MKFAVALHGNNHIPGTAEWGHRLTTAERRRMVETVDRLGFHSITVSEHLAMPYFEVPRLGPWWMHCLSQLAYLAGITENVRLDTTVIVVPYHHPLALAKALSTIDVLSDGRLNVSVGVGHAVREFEVLGVSFADRGTITDETLAAMKVLWSEDEPSYQGKHFQIDGLAFEPKPIQKPRPPIIVGGNSKPALRRAARHEGWQPNPTNFDITTLPGLYDYLRSQPEFAGKEQSYELFHLAFVGTLPPMQFSSSSPAERSAFKDALLEGFAGMAAMGITQTSTPQATTSSVDEYLDYLRWFTEEVVPAAK